MPKLTTVLAGLALLALGDAVALEETPCRLQAEGMPAAFGLCSKLTVPADPAQPSAASLELQAARIPALTATPRPDPLLVISGGPGQSAIDFYLQLGNAFAPVRRDRDLILLDQRGTGRSAAGFECGFPAGLELETAELDLLQRVLQECLAQIEQDPTLFTTSLAVQDLERLREALGVSRWNVYGVSYGTRVAQHYLRRFPDRVRALILDGVVPADLVLGPDTAPNAQTALDAIFARCQAQADCGERFGDLGAKFARLRAALRAEPVNLRGADPLTGKPTDMRFGEAELQAVTRLMSYTSQTAALLPLVIDAAANGNLQPMAAQAQIVVRGLAASVSFPMHNSVVCAEDVPFFPADAMTVAGNSYLGNAIVQALTTICAHWPQGPIDTGFKTAVGSNRPVLLLSGQHDPVTPPTYANRVAAAGLRNSVHLIGPGQGHGMAGIGCVPRLMRRFLDSTDPTALSADCLDNEPTPPFFLSFSGPAP